MWNRPYLLSAIADLLFVVGGAFLLTAALLWGVRQPLWPVREIVLMNSLKEVQRSELERVMAEHVGSNLLNMDLDALRRAFEQISWVRRAELRRKWEGRIEVSLEEHVPIAYWGRSSDQFINSYGEIFSAHMQVEPSTNMPLLMGPQNFAPEMLGYLRLAERALARVGRTPSEIEMSARLAIQVRLDNGIWVDFGRLYSKLPLQERFERFVSIYPKIMSIAREKPLVIDTRYPNGFALRMSSASGVENKGKP